MDIDELYVDVFQRPGTASPGKLKPHLPPAGSRTPMTDDGSVDIYGDLSLDSFHFDSAHNSSNWDGEKPDESEDGTRNFSQIQQLAPPATDSDKTIFVKPQSHITAQNKSSVPETKQNDVLEEELTALKGKNKTLQENISALYVTAKQELDKKDEEIKALRKIQQELENQILSLSSHKPSTSHHPGSSRPRSFLHKDADRERGRSQENYRDSDRDRERVREKYKDTDRERERVREKFNDADRERVREKYRDVDRERERGTDNLKDSDRERERTRDNLSGKYSTHKEKDCRRDSPHSSKQKDRRSRESSPSREPRAKTNRNSSGSEGAGDVLDLRTKLKRKRKEKEVEAPPSKKQVHKRDEITYEGSNKERQDEIAARGSVKHRHTDFSYANNRSSSTFDKTEPHYPPGETRRCSSQRSELTEVDSKPSKFEVPKDSSKDSGKHSFRGHELETLNDKAQTGESDQTTDKPVKSRGKERKDRAKEFDCKDNSRSKDFQERRFREVDSDIEKEISDSDSKIHKAVRGEPSSSIPIAGKPLPCLKQKQEKINDEFSLRKTDNQNKNCSNSADTFSETPDCDLFLSVNSEAKQENEDSVKSAVLKPHQCTEETENLKTGGLEEKEELFPPAEHLRSSEPPSVGSTESSSNEQAEKMQPFESQRVRDGHVSLLSPAIVNTAPVCSNQDSHSTASPLPLPFTSFQSQTGSFSPHFESGGHQSTNETWPFEVSDSQSRRKVSESADDNAPKRQANCDRDKSVERAFPVSSNESVVVSRDSISDLSIDVEKSQLTTTAGRKITQASTEKEGEKVVQEKQIAGKAGKFRPFQGISQEGENDGTGVESQDSKCLKESKHWEEKVSGTTTAPPQTEQVENDDSLPHLDSSSNSNEAALESNPDLISSSSLKTSSGSTLQTLHSLDTESSQTASRDAQSTASAPVSSESTSGDGPSSEAGSGDAQTESGSGDSLGSNPKRRMVITKTTPVKAVTHITCTSNLIMLGDEESRTNFSSPSRPHYSASDFYPPGVMGIVREESTHSRHIRGTPEVVRQISTGEDPTGGDGVESSSPVQEMEVSENSLQSGVSIMKRISETKELDVCDEGRLTSETVTKVESESKETITDSTEKKVNTWEELVKEQFRKVYNQDLAGFQEKRALHVHENKRKVLEKAFGRLKTALKPSAAANRLKENKVNQKNKNLETKPDPTQTNSSSTQIGESDQARGSLVEATRDVSSCSSKLLPHSSLSSELSKCNKTPACSSTEEMKNGTHASSQLSVCNRNANCNGKPSVIGEPSSRLGGQRRAICTFSFNQWKPNVIQQGGDLRSRKPQESEKEKAEKLNNEVADAPQEPDWMMEQILESFDCSWEEAMERDFASTTDSRSLHPPDTGSSHTKTLTASHDKPGDKRSSTQAIIHKDSRHMSFHGIAPASKDKTGATRSFASSLSGICKVTSSDEDASSSNTLHPLTRRKNKSPDCRTLEADSTCGISNVMIRSLPQEGRDLPETSGTAVMKGRQSTPEKQSSNFSGLHSLRPSDPTMDEDHIHKLSSVQTGLPYFIDKKGDFSNHISQGSAEPASPIPPEEEEENEGDAAFGAISVLRKKDVFLPDKDSDDVTPKNVLGSGNQSSSSQSNTWEDRMSPGKSYSTEKQEECALFPRAANDEHVLNRTFTVESPELNSDDEARSEVAGDYISDESDSESENCVKSEKKRRFVVEKIASVFAPEEISLIEGSLSEFDTDVTGLHSSSRSKKMPSPSRFPASFSSFSKPVYSPRLKQLKEDVTAINKPERTPRGNETPDSDATIEVVSPCVIPVASKAEIVNSTEKHFKKRMCEMSAASMDCEVLGNTDDMNKSPESWEQMLSRQTPFQDLQRQNLVKSRYGVDTYSSEDEEVESYNSEEPTSESENVNYHCEQDVEEWSKKRDASVTKEKKILPEETFSSEHIEYFKNVNKVKKKLNLDKVDSGRPCESRHTMTPCKVPSSPCRVIRDVSTPEKLKLEALAQESKSCQRKGIKNVESDRSPGHEASRNKKHKQRKKDKELESCPAKVVSQKVLKKISVTGTSGRQQHLVSEELNKERESEETHMQDRKAAMEYSVKSRNASHQRQQAKFAEMEKSCETEKMSENDDGEKLHRMNLERSDLPRDVGLHKPSIETMETAVSKPSSQSTHQETETTNADAASHSDLEEGEITDEEEEDHNNEEGIRRYGSIEALKEDMEMSRLRETVGVSGGLQPKLQAKSSKLKTKNCKNKSDLGSGHVVSPLDHLYQQEGKDVKKYDHWKSDWRDEEEEEEERKRAAMRKRRRSPPLVLSPSADWARRKQARRESNTRSGTREKLFGGVQGRRATMQKESTYREDPERIGEFKRRDQRRNERGSRDERSKSSENVLQNSEGRRRNQNYRRRSPGRDYDFHKNENCRRQKYERQDRSLGRDRDRQGKFQRQHSPYENEQRRRNSNSGRNENVLYFKEKTYKSSSIHKSRTNDSGSDSPDDQWSHGAKSHTERQERSPSPQLIADACLV